MARGKKKVRCGQGKKKRCVVARGKKKGALWPGEKCALWPGEKIKVVSICSEGVFTPMGIKSSALHEVRH